MAGLEGQKARIYLGGEQWQEASLSDYAGKK